MATALVGYYDGDTLRLRYVASAAPASIDARVYYETPARPGFLVVDNIPQQTSFTTDRTAVGPIEMDVGGGAGGVSCNVVGGGVFLKGAATTVKRGQFYVRFTINRQESDFEDCLCCGYVYDAKPFLTVGEHVEPGPGGGEGYINEKSTADPAANAEVAALTVEANTIWRPLNYTVVMAQGATQTPHPALQCRNGAGTVVLWDIPIGADVAVSTTVRCTWQRAGSDTRNNVTGGSMAATMPDTLMRAGDDLITNTQGIGAASDYGVAVLTVEEWLVLI